MFHEIIDPKRIDNLKDCCDGKDGRITRCYGLGQDYCPGSCYYATMKDLAGLIQGVVKIKIN